MKEKENNTYQCLLLSQLSHFIRLLRIYALGQSKNYTEKQNCNPGFVRLKYILYLWNTHSFDDSVHHSEIASPKCMYWEQREVGYDGSFDWKCRRKISGKEIASSKAGVQGSTMS